MRSQLANLWDQLRSSFWFVPVLMALLAVITAWATLMVDQSGSFIWPRPLAWFGGGTPDEARDTLATIASAVATIAGVVFSITMVVLTLASAQFGPRVLRQFMRDLWTQATLGTFVATFTFCLLVLRAMGSLQRRGDTLDVSVSIAVLLGISSLIVLVFYLHHVSASIQAANVIARLGRELESVIASNCPRVDDACEAAHHPVTAEVRGTKIEWDRTSAYVQAISYENLVRLARQNDAQISVLKRPGQFVIAGEAILEVSPADRAGKKLCRAALNAIHSGAQRTQSQDIEFGIDQMVQVALRALSPSLNDPATATICINHLASALSCVMARQLPSEFMASEDGRLRVRRTVPTFDLLMDAAYSDIRDNTGGQAIVLMSLLENLHHLAVVARSSEQRTAIDKHLRRLKEAIESQPIAASMREELRQRFDAGPPGASAPPESRAA